MLILPINNIPQSENDETKPYFTQDIIKNKTNKKVNFKNFNLKKQSKVINKYNEIFKYLNNNQKIQNRLYTNNKKQNITFPKKRN